MDASSILEKSATSNRGIGNQAIRIIVYPDVFDNVLLIPNALKTNVMSINAFNTIIGVPGPQMIYPHIDYTGKLTKAAYKKFNDYHYKIIDAKGKLSCLMTCGFMFVIRKSTVNKAESTLSPVFGRYVAYRKIGPNVFSKTSNIHNVIYSYSFNDNIPVSLKNYILQISRSENATLVFKERPMIESYLNMFPSMDCGKAISMINDMPLRLNNIMVSKMERDSIYAEELGHVFDLSNVGNLSNTILPVEE